MTKGRAGVALHAAVVALSFCLLAACHSGRSSSIRSPACCSSYQHWDILPPQPPEGVIRLAIGGDSRNDSSNVVHWAFQETTHRGAKAFFFLGDLEITRVADKSFVPQLADLGDVPFYPVIGNHEVEFFGAIRKLDTRHAVKEFKEDFLTAPGVNLAKTTDTVVYSADLWDTVHFIALDNVSRRGEGFGADQLAWLEEDLSAASAAKKVILVGMHKALANNPVTTHAMDEDGENAIKDSDAALALFKKYKVAMVFVSHSHMFASYNQDGIEMRLTGGLGAPLVKGLAERDGGFHHFLLVDVTLGDNQNALKVQVVKCPHAPTKDDQDEASEVEARGGSGSPERRGMSPSGFLFMPIGR
jgi:hypothetical protein